MSQCMLHRIAYCRSGVATPGMCTTVCMQRDSQCHTGEYQLSADLCFYTLKKVWLSHSHAVEQPLVAVGCLFSCSVRDRNAPYWFSTFSHKTDPSAAVAQIVVQERTTVFVRNFL